MVFAGCAGKGKPSSGGPISAPPAGHNDETCGVEGMVIDDEITPIEGAKVGLLGPQGLVNETTTAADGTFSFSFVTAGLYQLAASKPGFNTKPPIPMNCVAGESLTGQEVQLIRIPDPQASFFTVFGPLTGKIACGVGAASLSTGQGADPCKATGSQSKQKFDIPIEGYAVTGAVYELVWTRTSGFGGEYLLMLYPDAKDDVDVDVTTSGRIPTGGTVQGKSPLSVSIVAKDLSKSIYGLTKTNKSVEVRPAANPDFLNPNHADESSKLVLDQSFSLYATIFYLGEPVPAGYSAVKPE